MKKSLGVEKAFKADKLKNLGVDDQLLFQSFGLGEKVRLPYTHIHHAMEKRAKERPLDIAAVYNGESLNYEELNERANLLAHELIHLGVSPGDNIGLFVKRSIPMIIGIFAILKTGAAYVPQDVRITPKKQLDLIVDSADIDLVLTLSEFKNELLDITDHDKILAIEEIVEKKSKPMINNPHISLSKEAHCFILFTSGTTGFPNGVRVTHQNVCNILLTTPGNLGMSPGMKVSQILNISFDMASWEILGALSHGCTLMIRGKSIEETVSKVDIVIATPTILSSLNPDHCQRIKVAAVAGEPCPKSLAKKWSSFCLFYNSCGPTEVTIINTMQLFNTSNGELNIGRPTPNNTVYILDEEMNPCSIGEIGEMWAGGDCVSAGYLKNDQLTSERYKTDPFLGEGKVMFRTRDLGRWTKKGELEHFGRTDDQVKIRGFRVELDSVSNALESMSACEQAVTLKLDNRNLVAFVRPKNVNLEELSSALNKLLPYYSIPSLIIPVDDFPFTSRGKIDKRSLTIRAVREQEEEHREKNRNQKKKTEVLV